MRGWPAALLLAAIGAAAAEDPEPAEDAGKTSGAFLFQDDAASLHLDVKGLTAYLGVRSADFGAGTLSRSTGRPIHDPQWAEGYVKPILTGERQLGEGFGAVYGGAAAVWEGTVGDGDATNVPLRGSEGTQLTAGNAAELDLEQLYAGWRSGGAESGRTADGVDISAGRQDFSIGDGFLINDGNLDAGRERGYYVGGRTAWNESAILRAARLPLRADLFYLKSDKLTGTSRIYGANLELIDSDLGTLGAAVMRTQARSTGNNRNAQWVDTRNGMRLFDLRGQGNPIAALPHLFLSGEYAYETAAGSDPTSIRADGWYGEAGYALPDLPWSPTISLRHAHFSGDNAATGHNESFDSLFYAASPSRGWGTWYMGEIVGLYMLFNSNEDVDMVHLKTLPREDLDLGLLFYSFRYDQTNAVDRADGGSGVSSHDFGREIDLYADWTISGQWTLSLVGAHFFASAGGKQAYGRSSDSDLFEIMAAFTW